MSLLPTSLPTSRIPDAVQAPPLRWGIMAPGGIARSFADALRKHTRQELVAVGSRSQERADTFASAFEIPKAYGDYRALVADPDVDVVYVASPHSEHRDQALLVIGAGKHVLVEKAFARNASEAGEVIDAARAAGVALMEAMWTRFLPGIDVLRQVITEGVLGQVTTLIADHGQYFDFDPQHRLYNPDLAGGALLDLGVYPVSFSSFALQNPSLAAASGALAKNGVDGQISALLSDENDAQALVNTTLWAQTPTTAAVAGTTARAELTGPFYSPTELVVSARDGSVLTHDGGPIRGHEGLAYEAAHLAQLVADGRTESPLLPLDETLSIMALMDDIRARVGVQLPGES
jgi:predicted dehydrogenase